MTNRTLQFYGKGFGNDPVTVSVTVSGNLVYSGTISTDNQSLPSDWYDWYDPELYVPLFTMQVPVEFSGNFPVQIAVTSGFGAKISEVLANYVYLPNPVFTPEQFAIISGPDWNSPEAQNIIISLASPPFTSEEIAVLTNPDTPEIEVDALLATHGVSEYVSGGSDYYTGSFWQGDSRTNVTLNESPLSAPVPRPTGLGGDWTWNVPVDSTLAFDLNITAGLE